MSKGIIAGIATIGLFAIALAFSGGAAPQDRAIEIAEGVQMQAIAVAEDAGRTVIALAVDDWLLERLLTFDAGTEDLEDGDGEPDDDAETDGPACWNPATTRWRNDQEAYTTAT